VAAPLYSIVASSMGMQFSHSSESWDLGGRSRINKGCSVRGENLSKFHFLGCGCAAIFDGGYLNGSVVLSIVQAVEFSNRNHGNLGICLREEYFLNFHFLGFGKLIRTSMSNVKRILLYIDHRSKNTLLSKYQPNDNADLTEFRKYLRSISRLVFELKRSSRAIKISFPRR
jgi:hypothetical protein